MEHAPNQPIWEATGEQKRSSVKQMFSSIAPQYDRMNGIMSLRQHQNWRRQAVDRLELRAGDDALDLCTGTGDFLPLLREKVGASGSLIGIDFCPPMLSQANSKDGSATCIVGDACNIPLQTESVNAVTVGWGIRNVPDIDLAHREIFRVIKPGGRFVSIDCAEPRSALIRFGVKLFRTPLMRLLGKSASSEDAYQYLSESTARFWTREQLKHSMERAGFTRVQTKDLMLGNICMHWGVKP